MECCNDLLYVSMKALYGRAVPGDWGRASLSRALGLAAIHN